ncbi:hypothetical protein U3516DRAFT_862780, partial [Neocallimastix sp. 'constans']
MLNKYLFKICIIALYFYIKAYSKEIIIRNKSENFNNIIEVINSNQIDDKLIVRLVDSYYDMSVLNYNIEFSIITDVIIIGNENITTLDYGYDRRGQIRFNYSSNKFETVRLENLRFQHYSTNHEFIQGAQIIYIFSTTNKFRFDMENCIFSDNLYRLIQYDIISTSQSQSYIQSSISNCTFKNNQERLFRIAHNENKINEANDDYNKLIIKMNNCTFINNKSLFYPESSSLYFENCYFNNIEKDSDANTQIVLYYSTKLSKLLSFKNCFFENIKIQSKIPLIDCKGLILEIENTKFSNCYSNYGYLFYIYNQNQNEYIKINNSTFTNTSSIFHGDFLRYEISNSIYENIGEKNSIPAFSDSKYSSFNIINTTFRNIE